MGIELKRKMPRKINDAELNEYREKIGIENYKREYHLLYQRTMEAGNKRFSGKHYKNDKSKISELKEKYKNGISLKDINQMLGIKENLQ
jgi:hypothetical protein